MSDIPSPSITALILAGGQASRMGGSDKGLLDCAGRPLIEWVLERIQPVVGTILISANRSKDRYAQYGYPLVGDSQADYPGPLAGIESGLFACKTDYLWVVPCDAPHVDAQLLQRLSHSCVDPDIPAAVPIEGGYTHPTFALLRRDVLESLHDYLASGERKAQDWLATLPARPVDCSDHPEWFVNINTPEELALCAELLTTTSQTP